MTPSKEIPVSGEREKRLEDALRDIREIVSKRQLPITGEIWDIADRALEVTHG